MSRVEQNPRHQPQAEELPFGTSPVDTSDLMGIFKRGWLILVAATLLGAAASIALLTRLPPAYKSNVRLVLENSVNKYLQVNKVADGPTMGDDSWSQLHVISSEDVLLPVIAKLKLAEDSTSNSARSLSENDRGLISKLKKWANNAGLIGSAAPETETAEAAIYRTLRDSLTVSWESQPFVINISYASKDPAQAAAIANEIAESYINYTVQSKKRPAQLTMRSLHDRLAELRQQAANAEREALDFKLANNILAVNSKAAPADDAGIGALISNARVAMMDARTRYETAKGSESRIPDNAFIAKLREQYVETEARGREMERRVGSQHEASIRLRERIREIQNAISAEQKRVAGTYLAEYEAAAARLNELTSRVSKATSEDAVETSVAARARELEVAAETYRQIYSATLQRAGEENKPDREPAVFPDARILSRGAVPTQADSSKKRLIGLAGGTMLGLLLGSALLLARNNPFGVYRTPEQIKASLGLMPVVLPFIEKRFRGKSIPVSEYAGQAPFSRFSEGLRFIWTLVRAAQRNSNAKVIGIVSTLPGEGKTTVATNLASQTAKDAGIRTLVIDADFHRASLTHLLVPEANEGLREALDNPDRVSELVVRNHHHNFDVLPCPSKERLQNAAELLGSTNMDRLIKWARETYDLVIVESPPTAAVVDFRMLAPSCDAFILVVEWGKTSQRVVIEQLSDVPDLWEQVLCVVLNKVDQASLDNIEYYKGSRRNAYLS